MANDLLNKVTPCYGEALRLSLEALRCGNFDEWLEALDGNGDITDVCNEIANFYSGGDFDLANSLYVALIENCEFC